MSGFTPAPWKAVEGRDFAVGQSVTYADGLICHVKTPLREGYAHAEREANANLIAAAPDMFDALCAVRAYHIDANPTELTDATVCDLVCAALAKARGEQA